MEAQAQLKQASAIEGLNNRFSTLLERMHTSKSELYSIGGRLSQEHPTEKCNDITNADYPVMPFNEGVLHTYHLRLNELESSLAEIDQTIQKISKLV